MSIGLRGIIVRWSIGDLHRLRKLGVGVPEGLGAMPVLWDLISTLTWSTRRALVSQTPKAVKEALRSPHHQE
jgi:hypothetical protein